MNWQQFRLVNSIFEGDKNVETSFDRRNTRFGCNSNCFASDREDDVNRTHKAAQVFKEIMNTPDQGIPQDLLASAKCIAIIPGDVKFAFIFGGNYGRGLATCRTGHGWSAPMFVAIDGGSVGYQIGGSSTDLVMLFMNDHALQSSAQRQVQARRRRLSSSRAGGPKCRRGHRP